MQGQQQPLLVCDERFRRDKERLKDHDATIKQLSEVSLRLGVLVEQHEQKIRSNDERIDELQQKPAKRWDLIVTTLITLGLGTLVGYIVASAGLG